MLKISSKVKGGRKKKDLVSTKKQMEAQIKDAKKRLKEAEAKDDHEEIISLRNWLAQHDK